VAVRQARRERHRHAEDLLRLLSLAGMERRRSPLDQGEADRVEVVPLDPCAAIERAARWPRHPRASDFTKPDHSFLEGGRHGRRGERTRRAGAGRARREQQQRDGSRADHAPSPRTAST
jgi:hypothetical protein